MRQRSFFPMAAAAGAFFASGAAALVYQVAWQRILALATGVGLYSIALIVAVFLAGLGVGSEVAGRLSVRLGHRGALRWFAAVEIAVGLFGLASTTIYYDWLYVRLGWLYGSSWRAIPLHLATLGIPTALMGMSLPLLVRAMVVEGRTAPRTIGLLYGVNLVGAATGAVLTPWVLIRFLGIGGALQVAAAANIAAGLVALVMPKPSAAPPTAEVQETASPSGLSISFATWTLLYALSGFCARAPELVCFRIV